MPISFFSEDTRFTLKNRKARREWIERIILRNEFVPVEINYIFCSDEHLLQMNKEHLNHNYYTDIITFDLSEEENEVQSDIFISIDRVRENAKKMKCKVEDELDRVIIHGILHLLGYSDKTELSQIEMRKKEDECLSLRRN